MEPPNPPADDHTPPGGLTYNLRVGTTPGGANIITPLALPNGYRQVPALGNRQSMLTTTLSNLPRGRYYWSVQAIDTAFAGSPFANEATFVIPYYTYLPLVTNNSISYFEGPWEVEPNNTVDQANGSLRFDRAYNGYPDAKDYFYVDVQHPQPLSIDLVNHGGSGIQLQLKYRTITGMIFLTYDWQPPFHIDWNAQQPGLYYIYIFTETPPTVQTPYTLTVTSP